MCLQNLIDTGQLKVSPCGGSAEVESGVGSRMKGVLRDKELERSEVKRGECSLKTQE